MQTRVLRRRAALVATLLAPSILASCGESEVITTPTGFVTITPLVVTLDAIGATVQLTAEAHDLDGTMVPGATFTWASTDTSVVQVSASGLVTAIGPGDALVVAVWEDLQGVASLDVVQVPREVVISPQDPDVAVGATVQLTFTLQDANGHPVPGIFPGTWSSGNEPVAAVSTTGLVVGVSVGQAVITYDVGTGDGTTTVEVTP